MTQIFLGFCLLLVSAAYYLLFVRDQFGTVVRCCFLTSAELVVLLTLSGVAVELWFCGLVMMCAQIGWKLRKAARPNRTHSTLS